MKPKSLFFELLFGSKPGYFWFSFDLNYGLDLKDFSFNCERPEKIYMSSSLNILCKKENPLDLTDVQLIRVREKSASDRERGRAIKLDNLSLITVVNEFISILEFEKNEVLKLNYNWFIVKSDDNDTHLTITSGDRCLNDYIATTKKLLGFVDDIKHYYPDYNGGFKDDDVNEKEQEEEQPILEGEQQHQEEQHQEEENKMEILDEEEEEEEEQQHQEEQHQEEEQHQQQQENVVTDGALLETLASLLVDDNHDNDEGNIENLVALAQEDQKKLNEKLATRLKRPLEINEDIYNEYDDLDNILNNLQTNAHIKAESVPPINMGPPPPKKSKIKEMFENMFPWFF